MGDVDAKPHQPRPTWRALLVALRPRHWTKNAFVFAALVLTARTSDVAFRAHVVDTLAAFVLFCAASSAVYLLNDLADVAQDRLHPEKRFRPLAAGELDGALAVVPAGLPATAGPLGG